MANELRIATQTTDTVYAIIRQVAGDVWNGTSFETWADGSLGTYDIPLTDRSGDLHSLDFPDGITAAAIYRITYYGQDGASPALDDGILGSSDISWTGSRTDGGGTPGAVPTSYTLTELKVYMNAELGTWASLLGWTVVGLQYDEPVNETLFDMNTIDISTISGIANIQKLRILARLHMWRKVAGQVGTKYDTDADGQEMKRAQLSKHAEAQVVALEKFGYTKPADAVALTGGRIVVHQLEYEEEDPYSTEVKGD